MTRTSRNGRARLPSWVRWARHRTPVPADRLPASAPPSPAIPAPTAAPHLAHPAAASPPSDWRVPVGTDIHDGRTITVDFDRDAHLLMEGMLGWWIGPATDAVLEYILARGAHLDLVTGVTPLADHFKDSSRLSHYTDLQASEAIEAFHTSMLTAEAPAAPEDHRFLMIDGLNLLRVDARRGNQHAKNALDLLYKLLLCGRRTGHHVLAYDWGLQCNHDDELARLRAAFPAVLESVKPQQEADTRAVLLAHSGAHDLRLPAHP